MKKDGLSPGKIKIQAMKPPSKSWQSYQKTPPNLYWISGGMTKHERLNRLLIPVVAAPIFIVSRVDLLLACSTSSSLLTNLHFNLLMMSKLRPVLFLFLALSISCQQRLPEYVLSEKVPPIDKTRKAKMLSAFFGLDDALPQRSRLIWIKAPGKDGMPIVFSHEIDPATLDASDFQIKTTKGDIRGVEHVSYRPATEEYELRTLLLIGHYGEYPDNEPAEVEIIGELKTRDGQELKGQKIAATPLMDGPFISYAEYFMLDDQYPYVEEGNGCDCPKSETQVVVRTVWAGGVRSKEGKEIGAAERKHFYVKLLVGKDTVEVHPFLIADLNDNENNIDLCIKEAGVPLSVKADKHIAIDPNDDLNPETEIAVLSRW